MHEKQMMSLALDYRISELKESYAKDVAGTAAFLSSDHASFIAGAELFVDG
jgi:NAD(P)-dependent dehydrogenase (short-subunit alcohol dehydrogenase family)